ncbi:Necrosis inducing protein (NPP1) family protein [Aspergillus niger]|uniref:Necrosis inducing protein (NPP1) family protein n=1 Tax=Aspergillus niger TaxID=5061 RepID=A0A505IGF8_ASPNG|nr:Necrosis inducing protein (NPP1) family protein [Aspergillus niger]
MSSLADYLAKNYLNADPAPDRPKKKRKKNTKASDSTPTGLIIADDDPPDLRSGGNNLLNDDEDAPSIVTNARTGEFRRKKTSGWKTLTPGDGGAEQDAADKILADAIVEREERRREQGGGDEEDDDAPVVEGVEEDEEGVRMESGARAGLQTAAQTAAMVAAQERKKKADAAKYKESALGEKAQETIYRDASGRIINRKEREERKQQLRDVRAMPLARTAEDEELNDELKGKLRWNDPAAQFLTSVKEGGTSRTGKPLYKGGFAPNRYGIRPGHRWDGVDRGNGFEKEWFLARNRKGRLEALDYQWQMDE